MNKLTFLAPLAMAATLSLAVAPAFAETVQTQPKLCSQAPEKAAKAGVDCTTTSTIIRDQDKAATQYPSGPTNFGNGIIF